MDVPCTTCTLTCTITLSKCQFRVVKTSSEESQGVLTAGSQKSLLILYQTTKYCNFATLFQTKFWQISDRAILFNKLQVLRWCIILWTLLSLSFLQIFLKNWPKCSLYRWNKNSYYDYNAFGKTLKRAFGDENRSPILKKIVVKNKT